MIDEVSEVSTDSQIKYFSLPNSLENHFCLIECEIIQPNLSTAQQIYNLHMSLYMCTPGAAVQNTPVRTLESRRLSVVRTTDREACSVMCE